MNRFLSQHSHAQMQQRCAKPNVYKDLVGILNLLLQLQQIFLVGQQLIRQLVAGLLRALGREKCVEEGTKKHVHNRKCVHMDSYLCQCLKITFSLLFLTEILLCLLQLPSKLIQQDLPYHIHTHM